MLRKILEFLSFQHAQVIAAIKIDMIGLKCFAMEFLIQIRKKAPNLVGGTYTSRLLLMIPQILMEKGQLRNI